MFYKYKRVVLTVRELFADRVGVCVAELSLRADLVVVARINVVAHDGRACYIIYVHSGGRCRR